MKISLKRLEPWSTHQGVPRTASARVEPFVAVQMNVSSSQVANSISAAHFLAGAGVKCHDDFIQQGHIKLPREIEQALDANLNKNKR
jgi:hypothetical protein